MTVHEIQCYNSTLTSYPGHQPRLYLAAVEKSPNRTHASTQVCIPKKYLREGGGLLVLSVENPLAGAGHLLPLVAVVLGVHGVRPGAGKQLDLVPWESHLLRTRDLYFDAYKSREHRKITSCNYPPILRFGYPKYMYMYR